MNESLTLSRYLYDDDFGVFGYMFIDGMRIWTVERPWLDNRVSVSCIPTGVYECAPRRFNRGGYDAIEIQGVPGRSFILFHKANIAEQLAGCVAPGMYRGCYKGKWGVLNSAGAFRVLMDKYGGRRFSLEIQTEVNQP